MSFYKMDPAKWDFGTAELSLEEEAAYLRIINAIHKHEGPVPNNDRVLAGLFRVSTRKARALVSALEVAGKITIENGQIWNDRARSDLVQRGFTSTSRAESGANGGRKRAENAAKALKENYPPQAIASSREEKRREEYSEANASGEIADPVKKVFDTAVEILGKCGLSETRARQMVGKWRKAHPGRDGEIVTAIIDCGKAGAVDPIPWVEARLRPSSQPSVAEIFASINAKGAA
jgi:uncharacterized protein YdaU (DUF1376 family)